MRKKPNVDASKSSTDEAELHMWELPPRHRHSGEHFQGYPSDHEDADDRYPREEWNRHGCNHRTQVWPKVTFYSFGRNAELGEVNDVEVAEHLEDKYNIRSPLIFDVDHLYWCNGVAANKSHYGENLRTLKAIARHTYWWDLVQKVRPELEAKISQGCLMVNIVFTCWYGRQQSVAVTTMFREMLGTQPCQA